MVYRLPCSDSASGVIASGAKRSSARRDAALALDRHAAIARRKTGVFNALSRLAMTTLSERDIV